MNSTRVVLFYKATLGNLKERESLPDSFNGREVPASRESESPDRSTHTGLFGNAAGAGAVGSRQAEPQRQPQQTITSQGQQAPTQKKPVNNLFPPSAGR